MADHSNVYINILTPIGLARALDAAVAADRQGVTTGRVSRSSVIRQALADYLARHPSPAVRATVARHV